MQEVEKSLMEQNDICVLNGRMSSNTPAKFTYIRPKLIAASHLYKDIMEILLNVYFLILYCFPTLGANVTMSYSYEREQAPLQRLYDEMFAIPEADIEKGDDNDSLEEDNLEVQEHNTDSEQEIEESNEYQALNVIPLDTTQRIPCFIGRDGRTT
ncbi:hypothetical protein FQR65_LT16631 [Abscondita terminalis]|nr:hypothetical protein FQR65_LT16631 [Abscondita terminalis]